MTADPIRLLVCDIDGTLVRHDKSLSDANIAAAKRLTDAGVAMTLVSARPMSGMIHLAERLNLNGPFGAFNGGTLFDRKGVTGTPHRIPADIAQRLLAILDAAKIDVWLFADDRWYARDADTPHVPRERLSSGRDPTLQDDLAALCGAADKIVGVSDDAALLKRIEAEAIAMIDGKATVALSQPYFLDTTALQGNKGDGIAALAATIGVPLSQVAAIGDMANDLPMFARAGLSIAMGQGPEQVRAAADWVTASNEDDGVAKAIDRIIAERL